MPITAQELRNLITADDSSYQAAARRTQDSLIALQARATQATAAIAGSFDGFAAPAAAASSTFSNFGNTVAMTFGQAGAASQAASGAMSTSLNGVQAAAAVVPASLSAIANEAQVMGAAVASNGNGAVAALAPLNGAAAMAAQGIGALGASAVQAGVGVAELSARKTLLVAELSNVNAAVRSETSVLAGATSAVAGLGTGHTALNNVVKDSEAKLGGYIAQQALLKGELATVNTALKAATLAQGATSVAQNVAGTTTEALGQKTGILSALMNSHTTQITSQGTIWKGYDNVLQAVIRTMGGIPVIAALAITIIGVLAAKMLNSKDAAKDLKDITDELIKSDLLLASAFSTLQERTSSTTQSFAQQAEIYRELIAVDVGAAIVKFAESFKQAQGEIKASEKALKDYESSQIAVNQVLELAKNSTTDYTDLLRVSKAGLDSSIDSLNSETAARSKNEQEMQKAVEALLSLYTSGSRTIPQLEDMALKALGAGAAFDRLQAELLKATSAQEQLNAAAANYRPPKLDATLQTYDQLRAVVNANVADLEKAGRTQGEILIAIKPQLEAVKKAIIEKSAAELTGANASIKNGAAQKFLSEELKRGGDKAAEYAGKIPLLDKNIKALSSTTDAHAKASAGAHSAISQYAEGVSGLGKAFDVVASSLQSGRFGDLFEELPKKARKGLSDLKQAAQAIVKELDDLLKHVTVGGALKFTLDDKTLKPAIASLEQFGAEGVRQFQRVSEAGKVVAEEMAKVRLSLISLKQPVFEIPFTALYNDMGKLTESGKKMSDAIGKAGGVVQVTFTDVSKVVNGESIRQIEAMDASANSVEEWSKQWTKSLDDVKIKVPSFTPALDALRMAVKNLKEDIASDPLFNTLKMKQETAQAFDEIIKLTEADGRLLGLTQDAINQNILKNMHDFGARNAGEWSAAGALATAAFKREMDKLPGALDEVFNKLALGAKHQVSGIFDIINNIPGRFGDSLRKTTDVITKWINQVDGILKGLHKIFQSVPDGLAGMLQSVAGLFRDNAKQTEVTYQEVIDFINKGSTGAAATGKTSASGIAGAWAKMSDNMKVGLSAAGGALASFSAAMAVTGATGSKTAGILTSLFTSTLAGIQAGFAFGPVGGAIVGGVSLIAGIFGALFGGGKSAAQKAQEQAAADRAKIDMQQAAQSVINSAIEGFDKALAFFDHLDEFTAPRKAKFQSFWRAMTRLMDGFMELSKAWAGTAFAQAKTAAESMAPIATTLASLPAAFDAINGHFGVAQSAIDRYFSDLDRVMTQFFARADVWIEGTSKRAMKVANRLNPVVTLITGFAGSVTSISEIKEPTDEMLDIFDRVLEKIVSHVESLSGKFDKSVLKVMANFAEKVGAALSLWTTAIEAIKATVDIKAITDADAENVTAGIELFIGKLASSLERMATTDLTRIVAFAQTILPIANALKAWADTSAAVRGYTLIAAESWDAIVTDFGKGIQLMGVLIVQAIQFEDMAITLETILKSGAQHLTDGISAMTSAVIATASALQAAFGHIQGGSAGSFGTMSLSSVPSLASGGSVQSAGTAYVAAGVNQGSAINKSGAQVVNFYITEQPPGKDSLGSYETFKAYKKRFWREVQARASGMGVQIPAYLTE